ncbi:DUF1761 domain-containing protein [Portibacter marinus]|uniref:DUF1761 domain-containing protein n=1 Tax=Portibacter marinus TaxID=2898660 RepID=UPI001F1E04E0|nr:DUF1761 domain-containing protein [Portibacter marinus]
MPTNWYMILVAGLIPLIIGSIYYHPKVAGGLWMKVNGFTDESMKGANMALIFGLTYLFSVILSFFFTSIVIHQGAIFSLLNPEVMESGSEAQQVFNDLMAQYGDRHRSFKHGAAHGLFTAIFFILPIIAIIALFERRGWKYILIHFGYWLISLVLIGGLLCQVLEYAPLA